MKKEDYKGYLAKNIVVLPTNAGYSANRDKDESLIDFAKNHAVKTAQDFYGNFYDSIEACVESNEYGGGYKPQDIQITLKNDDVETLAGMIGWERVKTFETLKQMYDMADVD